MDFSRYLWIFWYDNLRYNYMVCINELKGQKKEKKKILIRIFVRLWPHSATTLPTLPILCISRSTSS